MTDPRALVEGLGLEAHPEGGWYRQTWLAPATQGRRPASSSILYLLRSGERSHWHRVDADEIWHYAAGDPLELLVAEAEGAVVAVHRIGGNVAAGDEPQVVVPAGCWQSAVPLGAWTLVGCIVAPAFRFDGFELAPGGWEP